MADYLGTIISHEALRRLYFGLVRQWQPAVCCDVGTNDGQAALLAQVAAPEARVFAFEANPEIFAQHHARLAAAGIQHRACAIGAGRGEVTVFAPRTLSKMWVDGEMHDAVITEPSDTGKTSLLRRDEEATYREFRVPLQSLDDFFAGESAVSFALWIDVEGAALEVLAGAKALLGRTVALFVETENRAFWQEQKLSADVAAFLAAVGFVPVARDREYGDDQFNVLFVPQRLEEDARLALEEELRAQVPVIVPAFNNPTHLRAMVEQLKRLRFRQIVVVDNGSAFPPMLAYLDSLGGCVAVRRGENRGPRFLLEDAETFAGWPEHFCLTDPDLEFNPALPPLFLQNLLDLTEEQRVGKAGFALDLSEPERMLDETFAIGGERYRIAEWEAKFWQQLLPSRLPDPVYRAWIDTTFALYHKRFFDPQNYLEAVRVAGRFTARHLPWYRDHQLPADEARFYREHSQHSFYRGTPPPA